MQSILDKLEQRMRGCQKSIDLPLLKVVSVAALASMLLAHGFAFANLFPNHDGTVLVFDAQWTMYVLGRWAQNLYFPSVRGKIAAPWLIGAFSIVYVALTGYCIAFLLKLRRMAALVLTGILGCCASVTAVMATYTYETDAYLLAMLLACAGVFFLEKGRPIIGFCTAAILFLWLPGLVSGLYSVCPGPVFADFNSAGFTGYQLAMLDTAWRPCIGKSCRRSGFILGLA